jgi:hypothetical protein
VVGDRRLIQALDLNYITLTQSFPEVWKQFEVRLYYLACIRNCNGFPFTVTIESIVTMACLYSRCGEPADFTKGSRVHELESQYQDQEVL